MMTKRRSTHGITFVEVMLAFLILGAIFLPIFYFLTGAVRDTERFYTETVAISRAKFIMDSMMFQIPWWAIREGNPCEFNAYNTVLKKTVDAAKNLFQRAVPKMFGDGCLTGNPDKYLGDGIFVCKKGFKYRARVKVVDLDYDSTSANPVMFSIPMPGPGSGRHEFQINQLVSKRDDKFNLIKKIIVQVKWSNQKNKDPDSDPYARSLFLVGFKSDLEG